MVDIDEELLARKFATLLPYLDERQRRVALGVEARELPHGGISAVARAAGVSRPTVQKALSELDRPPDPDGRVRRPGGGRKRLSEKDTRLGSALESLVDPTTRGDPMSPLRWTCKSTRELADALTRSGHEVSAWTVGRLLHAFGYSLQANEKTIEGRQHPDRDAQFRYIDRQVRRHLKASQPVVSVDAKKKELVGEYKNAGQQWYPKGEAPKVKVHDFKDPVLGKATPYGVYDLGANAAWVSVGTDHDTASFAVETLRRWWRRMGRGVYPEASRLLICADSGGSNSNRSRLWKVELGKLAKQTGLQITVCHFPPGTSKWNKVEHRLFAHISMNWRGEPLTSHEVMLQLIGATTTRTGLKVRAALDTRPYPKGIKVTDEQLAAVPITTHKFHAEWNYTVLPA